MLAALACGAGTPAQEIWIGASSANWSNSANWLDGSAPVAGGDASLALRFLASGASAFTATNDLGSPFILQQLILDSHSTGTLTIAGAAGQSLRLEGDAPIVGIAGSGDATISSNLQLAHPSRVTSIRGSGAGNLRISGVISESGGPQSLVVDATAPSPGTQIITLASNNTSTGGLTLNSGNIAIEGFGSVGSGPVTINGGTVRLATGLLPSLPNEFRLNGDLVLLNTNNASMSGVISSLTPGTGLTHRGGAPLKLYGASTYTGATIIDFSPIAANATLSAGSISLENFASLLGSSEFHIRAGGSLTIRALADQVTDHLADNAPIHLRNGTFTFESTGGTIAQNETVGAIDGAGFATIHVDPSATSSARLSAASLTRTERGTFFFRGDGLGKALAGNVGQMVFGAAPPLIGGGGTGADTSIVPFAIGEAVSTSSAPSFVTYSPETGIRPLNTSTEYATTITAGATKNVRLLGSATISGPATINALLIDTVNALSGVGPLTITSGAVLSKGYSNFIATPLTFGAVEANFFAMGNLGVGQPIAGTGGLTKSGPGTLTLNVANTFTGPLTINSGLLSFDRLAALGPDNSAIVINGHNAGLIYTGAAAALSRDIVINTGIARIESSKALILAGTISGSGGLRFTGGYPRITLTGANTYLGPTRIETAVTIGSDGAFGVGGALDLTTGGSLTLLGDWVTSRAISISASTGIDTGIFNAALSGVLTGANAVSKSGLGTLRITAQSPWSGTLFVNAGRFELGGAGATRSNALMVFASSLVLDNAGLVTNDRVSDTATVTLRNSELRLHGNAVIAVNERFGTLDLGSGNVGNVVTLTAPGAGGTIASFSSMAFTGGSVLFRGDNLGGAPGSALSRIVFSAVPAMLNGLISDAYTDETAGGLGSSFATYDNGSDGVGIIGVRPRRAAEYASGGEIRNPQNGGATPADAHFLAMGPVSATGAVNGLQSLTLHAGATVTLEAGQRLSIGSAGVLARAGVTIVQGGGLDFGTAPATFFSAGELLVESAIKGSNGLRKLGRGVLKVSAVPAYTGATDVLEGTLRVGVGDAFAGRMITLGASGTLDVSVVPASIGGLAGSGAVELGANTLTLGTLADDFNFAGAIRGAGSLEIVDGAQPRAVRTLSGSSTFSGGTLLVSGRLAIGHANALGTGPLTIDGGSLRTPSFQTILNFKPDHPSQ